jgi:outer membrane protein OmpA-like peptidoglycan-associated protein
MSRNVSPSVLLSVVIRMQRLLAGTDWSRVARYGCCALALFVTWLLPKVHHAHAEPGRLEVGAKLAPSLETHVRDGGTLMTTTAYKRGISWGAGVRYALTDWFSPQAELLYATRGSDVELGGDTIGTFYFTYLELPVLARVRFPFQGDAIRPTLSGYALLGGSVSYLIGAESVDGAGRNDLDKDALHTVDLSLIGGLGVAWEVTPEWVVSLEARYDQGFIEPFPDAPSTAPETKNRAFLLTLGVDFTLSHGNRDGDLLADYRDRCLTTKEDVNGYQDDDGCPDADLDSDQDGVFAESDQCPNRPEDKNQFEDEDGCPDADRLDTDKDGIVDVVDKCDDKAFGFNKDVGLDKVPEELKKQVPGCPPDGLEYAKVDGDRIVVTPPLLFSPGKSDIVLTMPAILDDVITLLTIYYPNMRVRIEGHADGDATTREKIPAEANLKESKRRADAVKKYLTDNGIDPARLETHGFGGTKPISQDGSEEGRVRNRRVEFLMGNPLPPIESP